MKNRTNRLPFFFMILCFAVWNAAIPALGSKAAEPLNTTPGNSRSKTPDVSNLTEEKQGGISFLLSGVQAPQSHRITFTGGGELGIFDPSIARDPETGRFWMSYSAVDVSQNYNPTKYWGVSIRLAYSNDNGRSWQDAGITVSGLTERTVGPLQVTQPAPVIDAGSFGIWQSETSTLLFDRGAPESERWKLIWFQYLNADGVSYFLDYSWLAVKTADSPFRLASAPPKKLFGGFGLQSDSEITGAPAFSPIGGPPAIRLNSDLTRANTGSNLSDLLTCVFAEPALHATDSAIYLSTYCAHVGPVLEEYVVLFKCNQPCSMDNAAHWQYLGKLLTPEDALNATGHNHYQAPDIILQNGNVYLITTPVEVTTANRYDGCRVYEFTDIDRAELRRDAGNNLIELLRVDGKEGTHNGSCAGYAGLQGGILYSQYDPAGSPETFQVFNSMQRIP